MSKLACLTKRNLAKSIVFLFVEHGEVFESNIYIVRAPVFFESNLMPNLEQGGV